MKVDKISASQMQKSRTNSTQRNQDLTSFGVNESQEASFNSKGSSDAIKNNFLSGISFKGHSKEIRHKTLGTAGAIAIGREPSYSDAGGGGTLEQKIGRDESSFANSSIEKTNNRYASNRVYFADPEETVNDQTKKDHDYIVYDNRPKYPRLEAIRENYYNNQRNANNYGQDFKTVAEYYYRREKADLVELNRLKEEQNKIRGEYETSLAYKNTFEEKKEKFPWDVEQIKKDKEKADYFFNINSGKYEQLNQKIGYYSDRIEHSRAQQQKAIQAFKIFDEVGLMFMDRDNMRNELGYKKNTLQYTVESIYNNETILKESRQQENDINQNLKTIKEWKVLNDKKASEKVIDPNDYPYSQRYDRQNEANEQRKDIQEAKAESERLEKKIMILQDKLKKIKLVIEDGENKIRVYKGSIEKLKKDIYDLECGVKNKSEEIKSYYHKMEEFYKNNIEEWQY